VHSSASTFTIGGNQSPPGGNYYRGLIDEVAVWNEALTAAEITTLYNAGSGLDATSNSGNYASASNLVGYYKMNEGTGTTIADASGNGNTATLSNMDAADWVTGVSVVAPFVTTWQTDASTNVTIPLTGSGYDFDIDWGDGTTETKTGTPGDISHTYATAGVKTVSIPNIPTGFPRIYVNDFANKDLLLTVESWGSGIWGASVDRSFSGATNLEVNATDIPNFSQTTDFARMFYNCSSLTGANGFANWTLNTSVSVYINFAELFSECTLFNGDISSWNVSRVNYMTSMFYNNTVFNQDISGWNVSSALSFQQMFASTVNFNQDLSSWDISSVYNMGYMFSASKFNSPLNWGGKTSNVTSMVGMFNYNSDFNQDISGWDVSNVTDFSKMFNNATVFSQDISSWNVGSATSMAAMFGNADAFNIDISSWDVSNVTTMNHMFSYTNIFNQNLNTWDVSSVLDFNQMFKGAGGFNTDISGWNFTTDSSKSITMSYMFQASSFNKNINAWNVSRVTSMNGMFEQNDNFDQDISNWDVSNVTNMLGMFYIASNFNQDLSNWDVSNVSNMYAMFSQASNFDQDISSWDISSVTNAQNFMAGVKLSSANYDALLVGWSTLGVGETQIPLNLNAHFGSSIYTNASGVVTARNTELIGTKNWAITDGGLYPAFTNFNNYTKMYFDGSFTIIDPTSASAGAFTYTSDNAAVATISGNTVTITGAGTANITATQAVDATYSNGSSICLVLKYGYRLKLN